MVPSSAQTFSQKVSGLIMLTPSFSITQSDECVTVSIHAPYTQLNDVEINALGFELWFYSSPYFLRLTFPCELVNDDEPPTSYNADTGNFEIVLRKKEPGQHFPDLDLLSTLLAPRKQKHNLKPTIEVLSANKDDHAEGSEEEDEDEWLIDQELNTVEPVGPLDSPRYGFGNLTQGVFRQVKTEFKEIIDLPEPDLIPTSKREALRTADEDQMFCGDHYLADFMESDIIQEYLEYRPPWWNTATTPASVELTKNERESMLKMGNKEFLLNKQDKTSAWLSLVDILYAFAYNHRTTLGESTVESAWTINKLSATLSWFANHSSLEGVVTCCLRRSLTYPLYRSWDLAQMVHKDTISILKSGRRGVLKCLLEVHSLFLQSEPRYLLNQLYITDYCIWLQHTSETTLAKLANKLDKVKISKHDIGFDLEELECAAVLVAQEEQEVLSKAVKNLSLTNDNRSSGSSRDSESSSSESSATSLDSDDES